jgi:solute carrier family 25 (mitochondrial adenine nucleotide translocator), member 4/5/6/31
MERIKILLQLQDVHQNISPDKRYKGIMDCAKRVYYEQGFLSFWRGNWTSKLKQTKKPKDSFVRYFPTQGKISKK